MTYRLFYILLSPLSRLPNYKIYARGIKFADTKASQFYAARNSLKSKLR